MPLLSALVQAASLIRQPLLACCLTSDQVQAKLREKQVQVLTHKHKHKHSVVHLSSLIPMLTSPCFHRLQGPPWPQSFRDVPGLVQVPHGHVPWGCPCPAMCVPWLPSVRGSCLPLAHYVLPRVHLQPWQPGPFSNTALQDLPVFLQLTVMDQGGRSFLCCFCQCQGRLLMLAMGLQPSPTSCTAVVPTT